jgi:regulatory protein
MNSRIYNYSLHLLARQDYSEFKLRQKLRSKRDNLPHEVDEVITTLKERGLLREEKYRILFIRKWMLKGESEDKIRIRGSQEMLKFADEEFEQARSELGFSDHENLKKLIAKKVKLKYLPSDPGEKYKFKNKILRFLITKGHDYEDAKKSLEEYFQQ